MKFRIEEIKKLIIVLKKVTTHSCSYTASTARTLESERIFNKLYLHLISFEKNLPQKDNTEYFDISTIASIARMIFETSNAIIYFSDRSINKSEMDFRIWLYNLHYSVDVIQILEKLGINDNETTHWFNVGHIISTNELKENTYFLSLPIKEQNHILKAKNAYYWRGKRQNHAPFQKNIEEALYTLLSNYVHSLPIGNMMYKGGGSGNPINILNSLFLIIETVICYSAIATNKYLAIRWRIGKKLTIQDKDFINTVSNQQYIENWIKEKNK